MLTTESNTSETFNANSIVFFCLCVLVLELNGSHLKERVPKERRPLEIFPPLNFALKKKKTKQNQEHDAAPQGIALVKGKNSNLLLFPLSLLRV